MELPFRTPSGCGMFHSPPAPVSPLSVRSPPPSRTGQGPVPGGLLSAGTRESGRSWIPGESSCFPRVKGRPNFGPPAHFARTSIFVILQHGTGARRWAVSFPPSRLWREAPGRARPGGAAAPSARHRAGARPCTETHLSARKAGGPWRTSCAHPRAPEGIREVGASLRRSQASGRPAWSGGFARCT